MLPDSLVAPLKEHLRWRQERHDKDLAPGYGFVYLPFALERVLTTDPGMGVIRHADAGYEEAIVFAERAGVRVPMRR